MIVERLLLSFSKHVPFNIFFWIIFLPNSEVRPNGEDMGNFYSAARGPVFFAHHGNIDRRLWHVWRGAV